MKYRKTFKDAWDETKLQSVNEQEENQDSDEIKKLKDEIQQWKLKYQQAKIDKSAPVPNPETGEVPLQTGIGNALLRAKDKKEADTLIIHESGSDGTGHDALYSLFDKGSYIVLLVDSVREWYRYRVTGNPSFTGTTTGSIHTYPIKLNQDFYNAGSNLDTADRVVQFWFMSSIQDVSSGYILMNANPNDLYSPYLDIVERTGPDVYDLQLRTRLGDLSGLSSAYLYGDEEPGDDLRARATAQSQR